MRFVAILVGLGLTALACGRYGPPVRAGSEPAPTRTIPEECLKNPDAPCPEATP